MVIKLYRLILYDISVADTYVVFLYELLNQPGLNIKVVGLDYTSLINMTISC